MKGQQAAFDKILPGVQARCAVFYFGGGWWMGSDFLVLQIA